MITATHYARAIDRYAPHLDALGIDRDELMLELLYRSDAGSCGRGWKGTKGACVRKSASQLTAASASLGNLAKGGVVDKGRKERRARIAQLKAKMAGKAAAPTEPAPKIKKLPTLPASKQAPLEAAKKKAPAKPVVTKPQAKKRSMIDKNTGYFDLAYASKGADKEIASFGRIKEKSKEEVAAEKAARKAEREAKRAANPPKPRKAPSTPRKPRKPKAYDYYDLPKLSEADTRELGRVGGGRSVKEVLAERKAADKAAREAKKAARAAKKAVKK